MIDVEKFLLKNNVDYAYALVKYNNKIEPIYFRKYTNEDNSIWFLESSCELNKIMKVSKPIDKFCREYVEQYIELESDENEEYFINQFIKPMIVNGWLYEIENFQCEPFLPINVDDIKLISEKECLEYMLNIKSQ